jgi:hypothetical protein
MLPNLSGLGLGAPTGPMLAVTDREKVTCMITQEECELGAYAWYLNVYVRGDSGPTEQLPHPYNVLALAEWLEDNRKAPDTNQIVTEADRVNCINTARVLEAYARERYRAPAPAVAPAVDTVRPLPNPRTLPQVEWPLPLSVPSPASPGRGNGDSPVPQRSGPAPEVQAWLNTLRDVAALALRTRDEANARFEAATIAYMDFNDTVATPWYRQHGQEAGFVDESREITQARERLVYRGMRLLEARRRAAGLYEVLRLQHNIAETRLEWYASRVDRLTIENGEPRVPLMHLGLRAIEDPGYMTDHIEEEAEEAQRRENLRRERAIREIIDYLGDHPAAAAAVVSEPRGDDFGDPEFRAQSHAQYNLPPP